MNDIKNYFTVDRKNELMQFKIYRMQDMYSVRKGNPDVPHRHDFFTVIFVIQAKGEHYVDFNKYPLGNNHIFFIHPGQVHQVIEHDEPKGYVLLFSTEFLIKNNIPVSFIDDLDLFKEFGNKSPLPINKQSEHILQSYCEQMVQISTETKFADRFCASFLQLFLIECNNQQQSFSNIQTDEVGHIIMRKMKALLDNKYNVWHSTQEYAQELSITPDYLNRIIKLYTGKTAKEYIFSKLVIEAKRLLYFSSLSAKEVGYSLGFSEPAHFSSFFKKNAGVSPADFKKS